MVWLVYALALFPPSLTVGAEELLQLVVVVDSGESLVMLVAQPDRAALSVADGSTGRWVDVVALNIRTLADEALTGFTI